MSLSGRVAAPALLDAPSEQLPATLVPRVDSDSSGESSGSDRSVNKLKFTLRGSRGTLDLDLQSDELTATDDAASSPSRNPRGSQRGKRQINRKISRRSRWSSTFEATNPNELLTFVPQLLVRHIRDMEQQGQAVSHTSVDLEAAVLYIDVAGFTSIMEKLVQADSGEEHGPEHMGQHINSLLSQVLAVVEEHGGDALQFSGDALLVAWVCRSDAGSPASAEECKSCTVAAAQCSEAVFAACQGASALVGGEEIELLLHIGLSFGPVTLLTVGGFRDKWAFVCLGDAVLQAGNASAVAQAGQLVASQSAVTASKRALNVSDTADQSFSLVTRVAKTRVSSRRPGDSRPTLAVGDTPQYVMTLAAFLPTVVGTVLSDLSTHYTQSPLTQGSHSFSNTSQKRDNTAGEMRTVSCIFIRLDVEYRQEEGSEHIQRAFVSIQKLLRKTGGVCNKLNYDDKGLTCLCVFGLPGTCHEDDPTRSITFCGLLSTEMDAQDVPVGIGVTRSRAYCGICGSGGRKEYTVLGDGVNLAARLMVKAFSDDTSSSWCRLLCDEPSRDGADGVHHFREPELVPVKGKEHPVRAYRFIAGEMKDVGVSRAPSLRASSMSSSARSSCVSSQVSVELPPSPKSAPGLASGLNVVTPLSRSLRSMVQLSSASGSELSPAHELFPSTTATGQVLVLERIEEMKAVGYLVDRLDPDNRHADRKRKRRHTRGPNQLSRSRGGGGGGGGAPPPPVPPPPGGGGDGGGDFEGVQQTLRDIAQTVRRRSRSMKGAAPPPPLPMVSEAVSDGASEASSVSETGSPADKSDKGDRPVPRMKSKLRFGEREEQPALSHSVLILEGEAGMGKSLLLHKACAVANGRGVPYRLINTTAAKRNKPYGALAGFLDELRSASDYHALPMDPEQQALLSLVLPSEGAAGGGGGGGGNDDDGEQLQPLAECLPAINAMVRDLLLACMQGSPLLICVDDAQWLDDLSWSLLSYLVEELPHVMSMVMSLRDGESECRLLPARPPSCGDDLLPGACDDLEMMTVWSGRSSDDLDGEESGSLRRDAVVLCRGTSYKTRFLKETLTARGKVMVLGPLNSQTSITFYKMVLGVKQVDDGVASYIYHRSSGNPGVAERLFVMLNERRALVIVGGTVAEFTQAVTSSDFESLVPNETQTLVASVTDKLPPDQQSLIRVMAVAGFYFRVRLVASASSVPEDAVRSVCEQFVARRILVAGRTGDDGATYTYSFRSRLFRDAVYTRILRGHRRALHAAVADQLALELQGANLTGGIAEHYALAQDVRAVGYLVPQADDVLRSPRMGERAARRLKRAAALLAQIRDCTRYAERPEAYAGRLAELAVCHMETGNYPQGREVLKELQGRLGLTERSWSDMQLAKAKKTLWRAVSWVACCVPGGAAGDADGGGGGDAAADAGLLSAERARASLLLVEVLLFDTSLEKAEVAALEGLHHAELATQAAERSLSRQQRRGRRTGGGGGSTRGSVSGGGGGGGSEAGGGTPQRRASDEGLLATPHEGWSPNKAARGGSDPTAEAERVLALVKDVSTELRCALQYVDHCRGRGGEGAGLATGAAAYAHDNALAAPPGLLPPYTGVAFVLSEAKRFPNARDAAWNLKELHDGAPVVDASVAHVALCCRVALQLLQGQYAEARVLHAELCKSTKSGTQGCNPRFALYALGLNMLALAGIRVGAAPVETRERVENALLYAKDNTGSPAPMQDPTLLLLMGCGLCLTLSRDPERYLRAALVMDMYNLLDLLIECSIVTPMHFLLYPALMEVLITAGRLDGAARLLSKYTQVANCFPIMEIRCVYWTAALAQATNDQITGYKMWTRCAEQAEKQSNMYDAALCKAKLVGHSMLDREKIPGYLTFMRNHFTQNDAQYDLQCL